MDYVKDNSCSLPIDRTEIVEFADKDIRKAFKFVASWSWFQNPGRSIFADRLYLAANKSNVEADLADAVMRFLCKHGFIVVVGRLKWAVRRSFTAELVDAACVAVGQEKLTK